MRFTTCGIFFGDDVSALPPPLFDRLMNVAPWTYNWCSWLAESLGRLETAQGYAELRRRLIDPDRFMEAWSVLQVAERLDAAGLPVAFDLPLQIGAAWKVPDLTFLDPTTGKTHIGEVSVLFSADAHADQSELLNQIFYLFRGQAEDRVVYSGCIFPGALDRDPNGLVNRVEWEIMETRRDRAYREINIQNELTMALAPEADAHRVAQWAEARGMQVGSLAAPRSPIDQLGRLRAKISDKQNQLFSDDANLLVIWAQEIFIAAQNPAELLPAISAAIKDYPKVSALVVVYEGPRAAPKSIPPQEPTRRVCSSDRGGIEHQFLIVSNDACAYPFSPELTAKICEAFSL